uniref:Aminotransferase n=1 Tax=Candidatus Kentrum sp. LPFa TaxID=2126335 RepID=A0A450WVW6_9GAMM|nr:MAG: Aminotransferase class I and II [Candidatus Kentron sp. LPFa]VFK34638.1 MAG: Aminotransferase class I and II [Candidatus Kentron sp. LPFa]
MLVIVNPNNPTGSVLSTDWIYRFASTHPDKLLVVDESFIEFSCEDSLISRLKAAPLSNVLLIKSLSKSLGVPGIRIGYLYTSNSDFNRFISKIIPIWNANTIAEYFLELLLRHKPSLEESFQKTIDDRNQFSKELGQLEVVDKIFPSDGNFFLASLMMDAKLGPKFSQEMLLKYNRLYRKRIPCFI